MILHLNIPLLVNIQDITPKVFIYFSILYHFISLHSGIIFDVYASGISSHLITHPSLSSLPVRRLYSDNRESIQFDGCKAGDKVMTEIDNRSSTPSERTMHLFINGRQQKPYATNLPPSICFITHLYAKNDSMTFTDYQRVSNPTHTHIDGESSFACQ